ncbi:MAG: DUF6806 family protein [Acidiferrobacterales bacterium]
MGFDHRLSCDTHLKPETTVEQVVEALSPLLDDFGFSREKVAAALHNAGKFNYGSSEDDHIQYDPETGSLEFWTCGHVSGDFPEAVSQTAQRLGPLSNAAGYLLLQDHDTPNLDEAQTEFYFGPSEQAIKDYRFEMDLSEAMRTLSAHLNEETVARLAHEAQGTYLGQKVRPTDNRKPEAAVTLGVFDSKGDMVGTAAKTLTLDAVEDIVDHATRLVLEKRNGSDDDAMSVVTGELEEALVVAGVIGES